jgi:hypothetical protein
MIHVHLIRTAEVHDFVAEAIFDFLNQFEGPARWNFVREPKAFEDEGSLLGIQSIKNSEIQKSLSIPKASFHRSDFSEINDFLEPEDFRTYAWDSFFSIIHSFRKDNDIPARDLVFLLTYKGNHLNWFVGNESKERNNYFIHLLHWNYFALSEPTFPVAYQVATHILKNFIFKTHQEYIQSTHHTSIGCMMDLCKVKKEVSLKMRTADICPDCWEKIEASSVPQPLLQQVLKIMESVRSNMLFRERFNKLKVIPTYLIEIENGKIIFPELNELEIKLNPLEMTIYCFFLNHPKGIKLNHLGDYKSELLELYQNSTHETNLPLLESRIDDLIHPLSNSASEKISRIKRKFIQMLGTDLAEYFIIKGPNGGIKKISQSKKSL